MYLRRLTVRGFRASGQQELKVEFPGRFSVLIGANSAGKTTICEALYLSHPQVFPALPRISASALGAGDRSVGVEYWFEPAGAKEGPLGISLQQQAGGETPDATAVEWERLLSRSLGSVRAQTTGNLDSNIRDSINLVYLPAWRNPIEELARREVRVLVELLRAQQMRETGSRSLVQLRQRARQLLESLTREGLLAALEDRVSTQLSNLTAGVSRQWPYIRSQVVDDRYLARVLELMLSVLEGREHALPLEVSALGYVNLLHIAVTLTAIPDAPPVGSGATDGEMKDVDSQQAEAMNVPDQQKPSPQAESESLAQENLLQARAEAESEEDSFFGSGPFHATVVIEEPEAHLHPQLQHSLVRHLRRTVTNRPELQVILSSHATDIITSCDPNDLVVLRKLQDGERVSRAVASLPLGNRDAVIRKARLHLDATRSSALFAERLILVEGVTDAAVVREFGWVWAGTDFTKQAFVDAVSIVPMGTKVGSWPVELLATRDHELCTRLGVLRDTDKNFADMPTEPDWLANHDPGVVAVFQSHPTLEPAVTTGNEALVGEVLSELNLDLPMVSAESVHDVFRGAHKEGSGGALVAAGPGQRRKGEFALALAARLTRAREKGQSVVLPNHLRDLFDFVYAPAASIQTTTTTP